MANARGNKKRFQYCTDPSCDDDMVRYFLSQNGYGHKSDSETHRRRDKPDTRATETWLETNNYD